jgi:hypothetical protein
VMVAKWKIKVLARREVVCGLDSASSREGRIVSYCEHGSEYSCSATDGNFLVRERLH